MRGPTCIFWANLTPFSLQAAELAAHAAKAEATMVRARTLAVGASWEELRMTSRLNHVIQAPTADAPIALVWPCEWRTSHPSSRSSRD